MTTTLDPEFVAKFRALTPQQKDELIDIYWDDEELPLANEDETWKEIQKRLDDYDSGRVQGMTLEEAEKAIQEAIQKMVAGS